MGVWLEGLGHDAGDRLLNTMRLLVAGTGLALGTVGCWWQIRQLGDVRLRLPEFYLWFAVSFWLYLAGLWLARAWEQRPTTRRATALVVSLVIGAAVMARGLLLPTTPTLSDDIYRYQWDGRVQAHGFDPYAYAPSGPRLAALRDEHSSRINFPHLRTVYPPLTQLAFRLGASLGDTLTTQKLVFVGAELLIIGALLSILQRRRRSLLWVVAYAWHPLPILEIAGSGHNDALGVAMLWLGVAAWELRRYGAAAVGWALAFLSKYATVILVPWWWLRSLDSGPGLGRGPLARDVAPRVPRRGLVALLLLSLLPLASRPTAISALFESLGDIATRFESNASLYLGLVWFTRSVFVARLLAVGLGVGFLVWWARREADPIRYCLGIFAASSLLSPVLHPWYLVWLIPCFCFWRVPALVALTGTVVLAYTVWPGYLSEGRWELPVWAHVLEYTPVVLLGLWEVWQCRLGLSSRLATKPAPLVTS